MRVELTAKLDAARYTNKSSPGTDFEESVEGRYSARQALYFLHCGRRLHLENCFDLASLHAILAEQAKCLGEVFEVVCPLRGFDQHIVYVDFHGYADLLLENFVHEPLVGCSGVLQPKGHDLVAVGPSLDDERGLHLVIIVHHNLIIAGVSIHEAEQLIAGS
ncbi:unnamed protein product [Prunus armeniaca]